ncbi:hypothetical protein [Nonomuraea angiospora]|uniref:hypothetical protein n=1 Tax=Nonomuraea angiospora TaxID=46172 RepID=UPI0029BE5307|nr:hypothetical protein [Nonomuraea angiospora]MDX3110143.1 hypothetical protein [Nonomuraea angiospora]
MRELFAVLRRLFQYPPPLPASALTCNWCDARFESSAARNDHFAKCSATIAAHAKLTRDKQLAVVSWVSSHLSRGDGLSYEEATADAMTVVPDLAADDNGLGPSALLAANTEIILHLVRQLARERGEAETDTWRREVAEFLREHGDG